MESPVPDETSNSSPPTDDLLSDDASVAAADGGPSSSELSSGEGEGQMVWAMGETSGPDVDPELLLAQLEVAGPPRRRETSSGKEKLSLLLIAAIGLGIVALWFHNETERFRSKVLGLAPANTTPVSVVSEPLPDEDPLPVDAPRVEPMPSEPGDVYRKKARGARALKDWELAIHMARQGVKATGRRDADLLTLLAESLVSAQRLDEAVDVYVEADKLVQRETRGHRTAARLLVAAHRCEDAVPLLDAARRRGDREPSLALELGRCLAVIGQSRRAVVELEIAVTRPDPDPEALVLLGEQLERLGRTREAIGAYERTLRLSADHQRAALALARLRSSGGDVEGIQGWMEAGAPGASSKDAAALAAYASFQAGRFGEAADRYGAMLDGVKSPSEDLLRNHAIALDRAGKTRRALRAYERALEVLPDDAALHMAFGHLLRLDGRIRRSITHLKRAMALEPASLKGSFELGLAHLEQKEYDEAAARFRAVLKAQPGHIDALQNLGAAYVGNGAMSEAVATYRALAAKRPKDASIQLTIGSLLTRMDQRDEAARALKLACALGAAEACR